MDIGQEKLKSEFCRNFMVIYRADLLFIRIGLQYNNERIRICYFSWGEETG